jgi:hypothetical protein
MSNREKAAIRAQLGEEAYQEWLNQYDYKNLFVYSMHEHFNIRGNKITKGKYWNGSQTTL